jgi:hypothetical protein
MATCNQQYTWLRSRQMLNMITMKKPCKPDDTTSAFTAVAVKKAPQKPVNTTRAKIKRVIREIAAERARQHA